MNGRQRLMAMLDGRPKDRVPWTTLVDDVTRAAMPDEVRHMPVLDFYKYIGCDIFQFGNYGLEPDIAAKYPYRIERRDVTEGIERRSGNRAVKTLTAPWGTIYGETRLSHPLKYPVENIDDLMILTKVWENTEYIPDVQGCAASWEKIEEAIGGYGIYLPTVAPSALQTLLEEDIGMENFYYMLEDYPDEIGYLIEVMHKKRRCQYGIVAKYMPFPGGISVENTSTTYISPDIYRQYSQRHMKDFVEAFHRNGKKGILHMCGHVNRLLDDFIATGLDGIHALTPPPIGDTDIEHALDVLGESLFIVTGIGESASAPGFNKDGFWEEIERAVTPRLKRANVLFALGADGLNVPLDRFMLCREWFGKHGEV